MSLLILSILRENQSTMTLKGLSILLIAWHLADLVDPNLMNEAMDQITAEINTFEDEERRNWLDKNFI